MLGNLCCENMIVPTPKLASFITVVVDIVDITYDIVDVCIVVCFIFIYIVFSIVVLGHIRIVRRKGEPIYPQLFHLKKIKSVVEVEKQNAIRTCGDISESHL